MEDNKVLKFIYSFFLGLILVLFIGLGINTFYPGPKSPTYPEYSHAITDEKPVPDAEQLKKEKTYQRESTAYEKKFKEYNRNVSIAALIGAVILLAISLFFVKLDEVILNGVLLGGLFTLLYSIGRGLAAGDSKYIFVVVTISLVIVLYLGYRRFTVPVKKASKK